MKYRYKIILIFLAAVFKLSSICGQTDTATLKISYKAAFKSCVERPQLFDDMILLVGKQMNIFSVYGKCLVPPGKHKINFVVWEQTSVPRGYSSQKMFDYDVEIELKSGGLYVVQEHPSLPSLNISLSCFAPNMRKMENENHKQRV